MLQWPLLYNFTKFAFWYSGAYLVAHDLIQKGMIPATGFSLPYGLLPLLAQEIWFRIAGASSSKLPSAQFYLRRSICYKKVIAKEMVRIQFREGAMCVRSDDPRINPNPPKPFESP